MEPVSLDTKFFPESLRKAAEQMQPATIEALAALKSKSCKGGEYTGWFDWPRLRGQALAKDITAYVSKLDVYFDTVLVIGIGGSYLGCRAIVDALSHSHAALLSKGKGGGSANRRPLVLYAGHNISESSLVELLDVLEERQPLVNVISKSGTTTEPAVAFRAVRALMERRFGKDEAARRIIATTDKSKGALRRLADEAGYKTFEVPDDVGGRYSVLTAVGLVPLALAGFDINRLLAGADEVFRSLQSETAAQHPALHYAACRKAAYDVGKRIELLAYAEPKLGTVIEWWKQLFGESEGKQGRGIFPAGLAYTTDLHSLGQYVQEGERHLLETFLLVEDVVSHDAKGNSNVERRLRVPGAANNVDDLGYLEGRFVGDVNRAAMLGTIVAHSDGGVPCLSLKIPRLDEQALGALFAFFETACAIGAELLGVNAFDQPGVEAYKKNLFGLLGKPGFEALGSELRRRLS